MRTKILLQICTSSNRMGRVPQTIRI